MQCFYLKKLITFNPSVGSLDSNNADKYLDDFVFSAQCIISPHEL